MIMQKNPYLLYKENYVTTYIVLFFLLSLSAYISMSIFI